MVKVRPSTDHLPVESCVSIHAIAEKLFSGVRMDGFYRRRIVMPTFVGTQVEELLALLGAVRKAIVGQDVSIQAIQEIESLRRSLLLQNADYVELALRVLELTYRNACTGEAAGLAAVIHETLYNAAMAGSRPHILALWQEPAEELDTLLDELLPDRAVCSAIMNGVPVSNSLVRDAKVQLGYLKRRVTGLEHLIETLGTNRARLYIRDEGKFEQFLEVLRKLTTLANLIPENATTSGPIEKRA